MRFSILLLSVLLGATPAFAHPHPLGDPTAESDVARLREDLLGREVRIGSTAGEVANVDPEFLTVRMKDGEKQFELSKLRTVELVEGRRSGSDVGWLVGGVIGAGASWVVATELLEPSSSTIPMVMAGTALGMAVGGGGPETAPETVDVQSYLTPHWDRRVRGRVIRIQRRGDAEPTVRGRVLVSTPDELVVRTREGSIAVARSEVASAQVYRFRPELSLVGAVGGGLAGFFGGAIVAYKVLSPADDSLSEAAVGGALITGTTLGILGLVKGFQLGRSWTDLPRATWSDPRLSFSPTGPGGLGLTVHGTF